MDNNIETRVNLNTELKREIKPSAILRNPLPLTNRIWHRFFTDENTIEELENIAKRFDDNNIKANDIYPPVHTIFRALSLPFKPKVIILGQDPYFSDGISLNGTGEKMTKACGFSFSCPLVKINMTPSIKNVYREIERTIEGFVIPKHGDLSAWVVQGVLLLNAGLTVKKGEPDSHVGIWSGFLFKLLEYIYEMNNDVILLLWGEKAARIAKKAAPKMRTLKSCHPRILGKIGQLNSGFIGCNHFRLVNDMLGDGNEINWHIPDRPVDTNFLECPTETMEMYGS